MSIKSTPSSLLLDAAAGAAAAQQYPSSSLYVVGTPIGNLADITLRAIHVLALVDVVACEDTRTTQQLLQYLGLHKRLLPVHEHNETQASAQVLEHLQLGERVAYVSDAGTPAVSDPGARLVRAVSQQGHRVVPIPGASACVTAISVAGDTHASGFTFLGFLPTKTLARREVLQQWLSSSSALVIFEAPHRVEDLAKEMCALAPERQLTVGRELSKQFEEVATLPTVDWPQWLKGPSRLKGEYVLVWHAPDRVAAPSDAAGLPEAVAALLPHLSTQSPVKALAKVVSQATGQSKNALYEALLAWRQHAPPPADPEP